MVRDYLLEKVVMQKKVPIPIPNPWHISWMIRNFTES